MNISALILGILLMAVGFLFTVATFGFGLICSWPLLLIGFVLFILGIISPGPSSYRQPRSYEPTMGETKRICPNCGKTMPVNATYCPHCGQPTRYK